MALWCERGMNGWSRIGADPWCLPIHGLKLELLDTEGTVTSVTEFELFKATIATEST